MNLVLYISGEVNSTAIGITSLNPDKILYVIYLQALNQTAKILFGRMSKANPLGMNLTHILDFEPTFDCASFLRQCYSDSHQRRVEGRCITGQGIVKAIEVISMRKPMRPNGDPEVLLAFIDKTHERIKRDHETFFLQAGEILAHSVGVGDTIQQALQMAQGMSNALVVLDIWREHKSAIRYVEGDQLVVTGKQTDCAVIDMLRNTPAEEIEVYVNSCNSVRHSQLLEVDAFVSADSSDPALVSALRREGFVDMLVIPMYAQGMPIGVMSFLRTEQSSNLCREDQAILVRYARLAEAYIDNAYLLQGAQQSTASQNQLLAVVSHDLRSPLTAVRMRSERLLTGSRATNDSNAREAANHILRYAERMDNLISDLMNASIIESGSLSMNTSKIDVTVVVQELIDNWQPAFDDAKISLVRGNVAELHVLADRARLVQAAGNLIGNALKFTPEGQQVCISVHDAGKFVKFSIADTGIGIESSAISKVFDKFWQGPKDRHKGIGLGLSIAKGIVQSAGGQIWLESTLGRGTNVLFTAPAWMPLADADSKQPFIKSIENPGEQTCAETTAAHIKSRKDLFVSAPPT